MRIYSLLYLLTQYQFLSDENEILSTRNSKAKPCDFCSLFLVFFLLLILASQIIIRMPINCCNFFKVNGWGKFSYCLLSSCHKPINSKSALNTVITPLKKWQVQTETCTRCKSDL